MGSRDESQFHANLHDDRKRHERELAIEGALKDWLLAATRFLVLANAGAAAATLAFIGAVLAPALGKPDIEANVPVAALCSLSFFIVGVGMAGFVILGQLQKSWLEWIASEFDPADVKHSKLVGRFTNAVLEKLSFYHSPLLFFSFLSFIVGGALGVIALS